MSLREIINLKISKREADDKIQRDKESKIECAKIVERLKYCIEDFKPSDIYPSNFISKSVNLDIKNKYPLNLLECKELSSYINKQKDIKFKIVDESYKPHDEMNIRFDLKEMKVEIIKLRDYY